MTYLITILVLIGVVMSILNLPGTFVITLAVFLDLVQSGYSGGLFSVFIIYLVLSILGTLVDNLFMLWGAKRYGATKWGLLGIVIGTLIGLITANFVIILVGPFAFAYLLESIVSNKEHPEAMRAAKGAVIGGISGYVAKFLLSLFMALVYLLVIR